MSCAQKLKKKPMRSLYRLKNTVNKTKLTLRSLTTLFDALIKPIVLYGAPLWTPSMSMVNKHLGKSMSNYLSEGISPDPQLPKKISLIYSEKVHLHFLKWALGVNRQASNIGTWSEIVRYPLIFESIIRTLKYIVGTIAGS